MASTYVSIADDGSRLFVKFYFTPKVSGLSNARFQLWTTGATPVQIVDPFRDVDPYIDYNSTSRSLILYIEEDLDPNEDYILTVTGVTNAAGILIPDSQNQFTTGSTTTPAPEPEPDVVDVVDHSVRTTTILDPDTAIIVTGGTSNADFFIEDTDPANGAYWVDTDHNDGRVTIFFSEAPEASFLNSTYFKVQRKPFGRSASRWETLPVQISADGTGKKIYIDFPSNDASPVYYPSDGAYFEENYKYRVRVSKLIRT